MKITVDLDENQLAKLGITNETSAEIAQLLLSQAIEEQIPYRFVLECNRDVYGDNGEGEIIPVWIEGCKYHVEYYRDIILADSGISNFCGTNLLEDDFLNYFEVAEVSPEVAHIMVFEKGYGSMFERFLPENERPDFKEFHVKAEESHVFVRYDGCSIEEGETYKVEYSPLTQSCTIEMKDGLKIVDDLDFEFEVTSASREVAEYMIKESPYVNEFNNYVKEKSKSNIEK